MATKQMAAVLCVGVTVGLIIAGSSTLLTLSVARAQSRNPLRADMFELVDQRGVARARLGLSGGNQESTYLYLMDQAGKLRVRISVGEDARIEVLNRSERPVAALPGQFPAIPRVPSPGGKADNARPEDVRNLQAQVDLIWVGLNNVIARINQGSQ